MLAQILLLLKQPYEAFVTLIDFFIQQAKTTLKQDSSAISEEFLLYLTQGVKSHTLLTNFRDTIEKCITLLKSYHIVLSSKGKLLLAQLLAYDELTRPSAISIL